MPKVLFASKSARSGDNPGLTSERLVNCYAEIAEGGARSQVVLRSALGYDETSFADLNNKVVRAVHVADGKIWVVASGRLFEIQSTGATFNRAAVLDDAETIISDNDGKIIIVSGDAYQVWDGAAMQTPGSGAFAAVGSAAFIDQYTVLSQSNGRLVEWLTLADPLTRNALNVKAKEGETDNVRRVISSSGYLWVLGEQSTEIWVNTGQANQDAFDRLPGAVIQQGVKNKVLCDEFEDNLFIVGEDDVAYVSSGTGFRPVSTPAVNKALAAATPTQTFFYEDRGHKFWCIRFEDSPAWCFDLTTGDWHERATGATTNAWEIVSTFRAFNKWFAITALGVIYELKRANKDGATAMRREAVSRPLESDGDQFSLDVVEFRVANGFADVGRDVTIMASLSKDGGSTFGLERTKTIGGIGEYGRRGRFTSWGTSRQFTMKMAISDPAELPVEGEAVVEIS